MLNHADPADCSFLYTLAATIFVVVWYSAQNVYLAVRSWR